MECLITEETEIFHHMMSDQNWYITKTNIYLSLENLRVDSQVYILLARSDVICFGGLSLLGGLTVAQWQFQWPEKWGGNTQHNLNVSVANDVYENESLHSTFAWYLYSRFWSLNFMDCGYMEVSLIELEFPLGSGYNVPQGVPPPGSPHFSLWCGNPLVSTKVKTPSAAGKG